MLSAGKSDATTKRVSYLYQKENAYVDNDKVRKRQELQQSIDKEQNIKLEAGKKQRKKREMI